VFSTNTEFFSTYNPDMIEEALKKVGVEAKVNAKQYKLKFTMVAKDQSGLT